MDECTSYSIIVQNYCVAFTDWRCVEFDISIYMSVNVLTFCYIQARNDDGMWCYALAYVQHKQNTHKHTHMDVPECCVAYV